MHSNNWLTPALRGLAMGLLGVAAASAHSFDTRPDVPAPTASLTDASHRHDHHAQRHPLTADQRPPLPSSRDHLRKDHSQPVARAARVACDASVFTSASGAALVSAVKNATPECLNDLFSLSGAVGAQVFPESKMITIANAMASDAGSYAGNNNDRMMQLTRYDTEFRAWLVCFASNNGNTASCGGTPPQPTTSIFADGFEGDAPSPPEIGECPRADENRLDNGCKISHLSAAHAGARVWLSVYMPAGVTELQIRMRGGTGDADIFHRAGSWPNDSTYDHASTQPGNEETLTIPQPASGWNYLMLKPKSASFESVEVSTHWH